MFRKLVTLLVFLPVALLLIVLSVANRGPVTMALNPFQPDDTVLSVTGPFFVFLFAALMAGIVVGGAAAWFNQGHYRKRARKERQAAAQWHNEADRQRERANDLVRQSSAQQSGTHQPGLPSAPRG